MFRATFILLLLLNTSRSYSADLATMRVESISLSDSLGATHSLADWKGSKAMVFVFLGTECPLAKLYANRMADLAAEYEPQGVKFIGINSNDQDTLREMARYERVHNITFPVLKDPGQKVADLFGVKRNPVVFLVDPKWVIHYQGRVDDQYGVGYSRADPTRNDLAIAINEFLAGRQVSIPITEPVGCIIGRSRNKNPTGDITYSNQVARILKQHCVRCHREGQIAPFTLTDYEDVVAWSEMMLEVIGEGRMPPWHANPEFGHFSNDAHMPEKDKQTIAEWVNNGMPKGNPKNLPEPEEFAAGWQIPEPDLVLKMPAPYVVPAKGVVDYQYFEMDPGFDDDVWVKGSEIRPGNPAVVHHVFVYYVPPNQDEARAEDPLFNAIAGFAPGMPVGLWPDGMARLIPKDSRIFFQVHYTPNGSEQLDQTEVGLVLADASEVQSEAQFGIAVNMDFRIPPGVASHHVQAGYSVTQDTWLHALIPHMHYRGKSFRFTARNPNGDEEILLDVPTYDFNWQNVYALAEAKLIPKNTVLMCYGVFDNSADNVANPDPSKEVRWGDQSWDEMMLGTFVTSRPEWIKSGEYPKVEPTKNSQFKVTFRHKPEHQARFVSIAGSFNDWNKETHQLDGPREDQYYYVTLTLGRGQHEYKFVVDGEHWTHDVENPDQTGPFTNSRLRLPKPK